MSFSAIIQKYFQRDKQLMCIGDSHIEVFNYIKKNNLIPGYKIEVKSVGGATAQGMVNPNSKTKALLIFKKYLEKINRQSWILIQLGEVDCGFVIWYRAEKYGLTIEKQMETSLTNYFSFLKDLRSKGFKNIVILGAILPTIKDNQDWGKVANLRKEIKATLKERTCLTLRYNSYLKKFALQMKFHYIDITNYILNKKTGVINEIYLNEINTDHHLSNKLTAKLWINELRKKKIIR